MELQQIQTTINQINALETALKFYEISRTVALKNHDNEEYEKMSLYSVKTEEMIYELKQDIRELALKL